MQIRASKTFNGRLGLIRTGTVVTVPDNYARDLISKGLATRHVPGVNEPQQNTDLGGAPSTKDGDLGNEDGDDDDHSEDSPSPDEASSKQSEESGSAESSSAARKGGGRTRPLSSQQVGRRSRKRT